jgi:hypothetical protein
MTSRKYCVIIPCVTQRKDTHVLKIYFMEEVINVYFYGKERDSGT